MLRNLDVWTWKILIEQYNWRELKNKLLGWVKDSSQKTLKGKEVSRNHFKRQCSVNKPCVYQWGKSVVTVQMSILMPSSSSGQNFFILKMHHGNRYMTKTSTRVSFYHPLLLVIHLPSFLLLLTHINVPLFTRYWIFVEMLWCRYAMHKISLFDTCVNYL